MDSEERRDKLYNLHEEIHKNSGTVVAWAIRDYCNTQLEEIKDRLVTCSPEDVSGLQGEARAFYTLLEAIETSPNYDEAAGE